MLRSIGRLAATARPVQKTALRALVSSFHVAAFAAPAKTMLAPQFAFMGMPAKVHFFSSYADADRLACTIFIGGLPFDTEEEHISDLFARFGEIESIHMPKKRNGTPMGTCFVRFESAEAAANALELDGEQCGSRYMAVKKAEQPRERAPASTEKPEGCTSIRFANVPYNVTEDSIREMFAHCGDISSIYFPKDKDTGRVLGYGFVEFVHTDSTDKALELDESEFNGRTLRVNYSHKTNNSQKRVAKPDGCKSVYVGNISADVNSGMLNDMFAHCGEIERVHIAVDRDTQELRGFAYVNFVDTDSVDSAIKLSGADLDGQAIRVAFARNREDRPARPQYDRDSSRGYGRTRGEHGYGGRGKDGGRDFQRRGRRDSHDY
ncbi:hypothetical protein SDRG_03568 [Saprolegnia diclina VS20]|uniref:RRM domain-containing protein n=1 Tax=Saprolegnia diclina (strain VS20) TaxID=1156394 RepID=T0QZ55_SAPDV|nr:hypothetical protein SDRG_03568 [Saprolegnia diclina VS20]EQC39365.1 hypothetical protein SDRG_03568 [Saprolegnia diclina VS20]|eukprot:XP_008607426.1 hypothetical protein SDRG_03568 [Saprolegnia diclina VS20]